MKFKIDQKVFYTKEKVAAVVKGFEKGKVFITYFPKGSSQRMNKLVNPITIKSYRKNKVTTNRYYHAVRKFHKVFNHLYSNTPTPMNADVALNRMSWLLEEVIEFLHSSSESREQFVDLYNKLKEKGDQVYNKLLSIDLPENKLVAQVDAAGDILYFNQGDFNILGVKPDRIFDAIQAANMRKLHNGKPKFRKEDGKIIKPDNWYGPEKEIQREIERQIEASKRLEAKQHNRESQET